MELKHFFKCILACLICKNKQRKDDIRLHTSLVLANKMNNFDLFQYICIL